MFYSSARKVIQMKQKQDGSTLERHTKIYAHLPLIMQPPQLNISLSQMSNKVLLLTSWRLIFNPSSQMGHCTAVPVDRHSKQSDGALHGSSC